MLPTLLCLSFSSQFFIFRYNIFYVQFDFNRNQTHFSYFLTSITVLQSRVELLYYNIPYFHLMVNAFSTPAL